jgi:hypothetical protein
MERNARAGTPYELTPDSRLSKAAASWAAHPGRLILVEHRVEQNMDFLTNMDFLWNVASSATGLLISAGWKVLTSGMDTVVAGAPGGHHQDAQGVDGNLARGVDGGTAAKRSREDDGDREDDSDGGGSKVPRTMSRVCGRSRPQASAPRAGAGGDGKQLRLEEEAEGRRRLAEVAPRRRAARWEREAEQEQEQEQAVASRKAAWEAAVVAGGLAEAAERMRRRTAVLEARRRAAASEAASQAQAEMQAKEEKMASKMVVGAAAAAATAGPGGARPPGMVGYAAARYGVGRQESAVSARRTEMFAARRRDLYIESEALLARVMQVLLVLLAAD